MKAKPLYKDSAAPIEARECRQDGRCAACAKHFANCSACEAGRIVPR